MDHRTLYFGNFLKDIKKNICGVEDADTQELNQTVFQTTESTEDLFALHSHCQEIFDYHIPPRIKMMILGRTVTNIQKLNM